VFFPWLDRWRSDLDLSTSLVNLDLPQNQNPQNPPEIFAGASPASLRSVLVGKKVTAARRHGKNLWLELEEGGGIGNGGGKAKAKASSSSSSSSPSSAALMLHFGMTGSFPVKGAKRVVYVGERGGTGGGAGAKEIKEEEEDKKASTSTSSTPQWPPRFCKLELSLSPGDTKVAYCDPRRFGKVQIVRPASAVAGRLPPGRDILNDPLTAKQLAEELEKFNKGKQGRALKTVLMEQSFLAGIGNWVADEVREGREGERWMWRRRRRRRRRGKAPRDSLTFFFSFQKKTGALRRSHPSRDALRRALSGPGLPPVAGPPLRGGDGLRGQGGLGAVPQGVDLPPEVKEKSLFFRSSNLIFDLFSLFSPTQKKTSQLRWDEKQHKATSEGHRISWITVGGRTTAFCPSIQKKTDGGGGGGEEEEEEEGKEEEDEKPKSKAAASKRKQAPAAPKAAAAAKKKKKKPVAVPKAPARRTAAAAAPAARGRVLPRI